MGGWVSPRASLDAVVRRKIPSPYWDLKSQSSSPKPSAIPLSYPGSLPIYKVLENMQYFIMVYGVIYNLDNPHTQIIRV
jgi:hypothetical protein